MASSYLVIATGGLGPTGDDLTRYALSDAIGEPLEENADAMGQLRAMFERLQRPFHNANKVEAMIPRGCRVIPNSRGTAPGMVFDDGVSRLFVLPGVPAEMKAMFEEEVACLLKTEVGSGRTVVRRTSTPSAVWSWTPMY